MSQHISNKQRKAIKTVSYFTNMNYPISHANLSAHGIANVQESKDGDNPEIAYIAYTSQGIKPKAVTDLKKFYNLVVAHRRMALQEKMWREGFKEGILFFSDFDDLVGEDEEQTNLILDLIKKIVCNQHQH